MSFCPRKYCEGENIPKEVKPKTQATFKGKPHEMNISLEIYYTRSVSYVCELMV